MTLHFFHRWFYWLREDRDRTFQFRHCRKCQKEQVRRLTPTKTRWRDAERVTEQLAKKRKESGESLMFFHSDLLIGSYWFELSTAGYYFEACDDLPPSRSRLREWLGGLIQPMKPEVEPVTTGS